ncbi:MAG: hypothetical protein K0R12_1338 [Gammaproteobacteria bacterium]|jgi:hypothetical protein|nr:hypothetical protein [Gammaproteobacteria bacterium]
MDFLQSYQTQLAAISQLMLVTNAIVHIIFAGAVAKDAGRLHKLNQPTWLVSGVTWAFATLAGGVFVAGVYWFIHHFKRG